MPSRATSEARWGGGGFGLLLCLSVFSDLTKATCKFCVKKIISSKIKSSSKAKWAPEHVGFKVPRNFQFTGQGLGWRSANTCLLEKTRGRAWGAYGAPARGQVKAPHPPPPPPSWGAAWEAAASPPSWREWLPAT